MDQNKLKINIGDRVVISRPTSTRRYASHIERSSAVTAVRPKSFDAGGLCFRNDGREWNGHNRVRFVPSGETIETTVSPVAVEEPSRDDRAREVAMLAFLMSSRHEMDWLNLGLEELRRIAALHGIMTQGQETQAASRTPASVSAKRRPL